MRAFFKQLPVGIGGVALGLIGLGTLLQTYGIGFLYLFGAVSILFLMTVIIKLFIPGEWCHIFSDDISMGTFAGTSMAMMLVMGQVKSVWNWSWTVVIWTVAIILHFYIIIVFSRKIITEKPGWNAVRGCWMLVYVGIAAAAISAPAFSAETIGRILLIPAGAAAVILLPLVYRADRKATRMPPAQRPFFCITAAPVSIWLVGWIRCAPEPTPILATGLILVEQIFYLPALIRCIRRIKDPFVPSFASFTFPFVISASAAKFTSGWVSVQPLGAIMSAVYVAETVIAVILCCVVSFWYFRTYFIKTG